MPPSRDTDVGVVLLHGAMLGRWIWERVEPRLGAPALAVDFPGRGEKPADITTLKLGDVVDSVVADIEAWPTPPIVLVAHSRAGRDRAPPAARRPHGVRERGGSVGRCLVPRLAPGLATPHAALRPVDAEEGAAVAGVGHEAGPVQRPRRAHDAARHRQPHPRS